MPASEVSASRRRSFPRWLWPLAVLALLAIAWQAFASFAFEPLVQRHLPRWLAERSGGHALTMQRVAFDPWRLALQVQGLRLATPEGAPLLELAQADVDLDGASAWRAALVLQAVQIQAPVLHLHRGAEGAIAWDRFVQAMAGPPAEDAPQAGESGPPRLALARLRVADGRVLLHDEQPAGGFRAALEALQFELDGLSGLDTTPATHRLSARSDLGAVLRAEGTLALAPLAASGEVALEGLALERLWPYLQAALASAPPQGRVDAGLRYRWQGGGGAPQVQVEGARLSVSDLALRDPGAAAPALVFPRITLDGGRADLATRQAEIGTLAVEGGRVALKRDADGALDLLRWLKPAQAAAEPQPAAAAPEAPWRLRLGAARVKGLALRLDDASRAQPLVAEVERVGLAARAEAELGGAAPRVQVDGLTLDLAGLRLASPAGGREPFFVLDTLAVGESRVVLHERQLALGAVTLQGGRATLERDARGALPLMALAQPARPGRAPAPERAEPGVPAWRLRAAGARLAGFAVAATDRSVSPAAALQLRELQAELGPWASDAADAAAPIAVALRGRAAGNGRFTVQGRVLPTRPAADLQVSLDGLLLAPLAPYVRQATALALKDGDASTRGRLQLDGARWRYTGGFAVRRLDLVERASGDPLFAFEELSTRTLAVSDAGLRIGELLLDGLVTKVTIYPDRSVNLARVLAPAGTDEAPPATTAAPAASAAPTAPAAPKASPARDAFAVAVERVRLTRGSVDFADLSLALPFAARVLDLEGQVVGISSAQEARATVEVGGRVDDYGDARVTGSVQVFDPTAFMDLRVRFRNVEMTTLTPYTATFAGRRIDSGKLSLDLQYRIEQRRLLGDNQVVMDRLTLGERVEAPNALNLPLDLAVALLQDSEGRIELGLPVSGTLDDPQFAIGPLVWKAIVNLLTRIVTAPFRALASLFGSDEALDRIAFDPGSPRLAPPEREKLARLAEALAKRPGLQLGLPAAYEETADAAALREQSLRRAVAGAAGRVLADGEAPGPVVVGDAATQAALERLFVQRFGAPALAEARAAAAAKPAAEAPVHEALRQRLLATQPLPEGALPALAAQRAEAIRGALVERGVDAARLRVESPAAAALEGGFVVAPMSAQAASATPAVTR